MAQKHDISEERKEQILEAATIVLSEKGVHETRMDDIATESGVSKGLLYWYFKNKEEIIVAIAKRMFSREIVAIHELAERDGSATEILYELLEAMILDTRKIQPLLPLLYEFFAMVLRKKWVHQVVHEVVGEMFIDIEKIVQRGVDQGEFRDVDPHDTAVAIGSIIEGTYIIWAYAPEQVDIEKHIRSGVLLLIHGLVV